MVVAPRLGPPRRSRRSMPVAVLSSPAVSPDAMYARVHATNVCFWGRAAGPLFGGDARLMRCPTYSDCVEAADAAGVVVARGRGMLQVNRPVKVDATAFPSVLMAGLKCAL